MDDINQSVWPIWPLNRTPPNYLRAALVTPPVEMPVSLTEAKAHLRKDDPDEDGLIGGLIAAATAHLDGPTGILGRCLITQAWRQDLDRWPDDWIIRLPLVPVQSVAVAYVGQDGSVGALAPSDLQFITDARGATVRRPRNVTWPALTIQPDAIRVTMVAGYGLAASVPAPLKQAMLLLIGHWHENREASVVGQNASELPLAVDALIRPYREVNF